MSSFLAGAQNEDWLWVRKAGGMASEAGSAISADKSGNVVVTGSYNSAAITFGNHALLNAGGYDFFIVKYDPQGNVLWARNAGGTGDEKGLGISTDTTGNVLVCGTFSSDQVQFDNITLTHSDSTDIFLVKYSPDGQVVWARSAGGQRQDHAGGVAADDAGNIYLTGYFNSSSIHFSDHSISNTHTGYYDIFLARYDTNGNVDWLRSASGYFSDKACAVSCDHDGNVFVTGYFYSSEMYFGNDTIFNNGKYNYFLASYRSAGNLNWAVGGGGSEVDKALAVTTDYAGNVFITGSFTSPEMTVGNNILTNAGGSDIFIAQYDPDGNATWAESIGGPDQDAASAITSASDTTSICVTGYFKSASIEFGNNILNNTSAGNADIFTAVYNSSHQVILAIKADGIASDYCNGIAADHNGNFYLTGSFYSSELYFGNYTLYRTGQDDMFLVKYGPNTAGVAESDQPLMVTVCPNPVINSGYILYNLKSNDPVTVKIYDLFGVEMSVIYDDIRSPGRHEVCFDGSGLAGGIYIYSISAGSRTGSGKIMLIKR